MALIDNDPDVVDKKASHFVDQIAAQLAQDADTQPLRFDGVPGTREQHAQKSRHMRRRLAAIVRDYPREARETADAWVRRVTRSTNRREDFSVFSMVGRLHAVIERMDDEAEVELRRQADEANAKHQSMIDNLRRRAAPDAKEIAQLVSTVEAAREGEELLAQVFAAFTAHGRAQEARARLSTMFDGIEAAKVSLQAYGEPFKTKAVKRPQVADAPESAIQLATLLQRVVLMHKARD